MEKLDREWDVACLRLEEYLQAHGVRPRGHLLALVLETIQEARSLKTANPDREAVEATMEIAVAKTDAWFSALAGSPEKAIRARVAFFSSPVHDRWASAFWQDSMPEELISEVRAAYHEAGPALDFQSLVRREMDYGAMEDIARETWEQFSWGHVMRAFLLWVVLFLAAYGIYLKFFA